MLSLKQLIFYQNITTQYRVYVCIFKKKKKKKIDAIVLAKVFIEELGDAIMNLALIGVLCILGIQYISIIFNRNVVNNKFNFQISCIFINDIICT